MGNGNENYDLKYFTLYIHHFIINLYKITTVN